MVESNGQDVHVPWFSGLCLDGEVAGQYEMDLTGTQLELESTTSDLLELDGLGPITMFVGANNSGKSRLMRKLFRLEKAAKTKLGTRTTHDLSEENEVIGIDIGVSVESWLINLRESNRSEFTNGWMPESSRVKINEQLLMPPSKHARSLNGPNWSVSMSRLNRCGIKDKLPAFQSKNRCYVPMLRGMRPPAHKQYCGPKTEEYEDLYKQRTVHDYFEGTSKNKRFPVLLRT